MQDDLIINTVKFNQGHIDVHHYQPTRNAILERNKRIQNEKPLRKTEGLALSLIIPTIDYQQLIKANPDLVSVDAATKKRAWDQFIQSGAAAPYLVGTT